MGIDDDIDERLALISRQDKIDEDRLIELRRISSMPFHLRIQEKSQKNVLERVYNTQKDTFDKICKRERIYKLDWKDEFALFWIGYLKGEYKSINEYLKRKNFSNETPQTT